MTDDSPPTPAELNEKVRGPLLEQMGLEWIEATPERIVARIPVSPNAQPGGILHGGASGVMVESIGSLGAWLFDRTKLALGVELKVNHLKPATSGWVTGVGRPLHSGRSLAVWAVEISDDQGRMTAFGTCTVALRERRE
ncbi:MAG TPA: PaaI family thioesterase [Actinomycetota bacterium]|nr:PaaI family thioesterase [Actinomycetota bacterium]